MGSLNPPKLAGVRSALACYAPQAEVQGLAADSGVPEQPVGFEEIVRGARNRAAAALAHPARDPDSEAGLELGVGYEDGLVQLPGAGPTWFNVGCAAVADQQHCFLGLSSGFAYPEACAQPAASRREPVGQLFDALFPDREEPAGASALSLGNIGVLTAAALPRADYTRQAVLCALVGFLHPTHYPAAPSAA